MHLAYRPKKLDLSLLLTGSCKFFGNLLLFAITLFSLTIFSDRFRTTLNVFGDSIGCAIVHHLSRKELQTFDNKEYTTSTTDKNKSHIVPPMSSSDGKTSLGTRDDIIIHQPNDKLSTAYDNSTFTNRSEIHSYSNDNNVDRPISSQ